ncbi:MAG: hypothetical protein OXE94_05200 [Aestuariivita sp.]|nr:hypothetical protein [Aestuariivita sp.]MCY4201976.1 hypothetical protein [Aestuariivita sp.]MCY4288214.1 hypothetical protein [Aestuariivita sp.]MCY4346221.1 hypothetical protein [Aestuariivita sp.]
MLKKSEFLPNRRQVMSGLATSPLAIGAEGLFSPSIAHLISEKEACNWPTSTTISASGSSDQVVALPYGDGVYIQAKIVFNVSNTGIALKDIFDDGKTLADNDTIVTSLGSSYATVFDPTYQAEGISKSIPPRQATVIRASTAVRKATVDETPAGGSTDGPVHLAFIRTASPRNIANALADSDRWQSYTKAGCWPSGVGPYPLWMSTRAEMTNLNLSFNPWTAANQATPDGKGNANFSVNSNIWWLPSMSDAAVHHCHYKNFIEVHTQLLGLGRMQKFNDQTSRVTDCSKAGTYPLGTNNPVPSASYYAVPGISSNDSAFGPGLYEEYRLAPGETNVPFPYVDDDMNFIYPWHQYYADTDCLWVVWELIPNS